jgi:hypothetical protein
MSFPPGWNTVEETSLWHDVFWWIGIVALVVLAISEILAKRYGDRKDELIAAAATKQTEQQQE